MLFLEGNKLDKEKSPLWDPKTTLKGPFLVWFGPIFGSFFSTFLGNFHEFSAVSALFIDGKKPPFSVSETINMETRDFNPCNLWVSYHVQH